MPVLNTQFHLTSPLFALPATVANPSGSAVHPLPIPVGVNSLGGVGFQSFWVNSGICGTGVLSATNALSVL